MHTAKHDYLTNEVLTATPEKLQLLLVEGALRQIHVARTHWKSGDLVAASDALIRCQQIVAEMIAGLEPEQNTDLVKRIVSVYLFVYRRLVEANVERRESQLDDAVRVLEVERDTWRKASQKSARPLGVQSVDETSRLGQSFVA